jgi:membrane-associated phospholipid phosphatase
MKGEPRWHWSIPVLWAGLGAAWYYGLLARSDLPLHCVQTPTVCEPQGVNWIDRWVLSYAHSPLLDTASFVTQDTAGVFFLLVAAFLAWRAPRNRVAFWLKSWGMGLTTTLLNGVCTEIARHLGQRPRPFVYLNNEFALNPQNYVSFYSGHTSFAACITTLAGLMLHHSDLPRSAKRAGTAAAVILTFLTGLFRVLSGRHFVTDVTAGAIAGALVAWGVFWLSTRPKASN